jgi:hypothetical protein
MLPASSTCPHRHEPPRGYAGAGPRYLAQDILADHLGFAPGRPIAIAYRSYGPARWEQGRPWHTTSSEIDVFLSQDDIQAKLAEQLEWGTSRFLK